MRQINGTHTASAAAHRPWRERSGDRPGRTAHSSAGFTLFELMVTVAVAAVLFTVGVPSFMNFVANMRATSYTNDLVLALNLARSEATRRGAPVDVCSSTDANTCDGTDDWTTGWIVRTAAGTTLRTWEALGGGSNVIVAADGAATTVRFLARGAVDAPQTFNVRIPNCTGDRGRDVSINFTGRVQVNRVAC